MYSGLGNTERLMGILSDVRIYWKLKMAAINQMYVDNNVNLSFYAWKQQYLKGYIHVFGVEQHGELSWWEYWESAIERNCHIKNAHSSKFKMAAAAILNFENVLPFLHYWTNPHQILWEYGKFNLKRNRYVKNPYSIIFNVAAAAILKSESCCHFFTIKPMCTKFYGNVANMIWNALYCQETQLHQKSRWRLPPSWISNNFCNFFTIWPILTKLGGDDANSMLNATVESEMSTRIKFKDGGCRHIEFRKDVVISLLLNRFSTNMSLTSKAGLLVEKRQIFMLKTI